MFFFIGGVQPRTVLVDKQAKLCAECGSLNVYLKRVDHYLSVFFIPLFPVKKGNPFMVCDNCNTLFDEHGSRMDFKQKGGPRRCPRCGRSIAYDFSFCPYCGREISS